MNHRFVLSAALAVPLAWPAAAQDTGDSPANALQKRMFYRSFVQDAPACRQSVAAVDGKAMFQGPVAGSAAATCPDAFAWTQFASAVSEGFWNWGTDQTGWPAKPWPICTSDQSYPAEQCCEPGTVPAEQPDACPVFRADYDPPSPLAISLSGNPSNDVRSHHALNLADQIDPARVLRDLELELVFRNKAMIDYIYREDLYTTEGLAARNRAQNAALDDGDLAAAHGLEVRFPVDSVMVKADFIHQTVMADLGLIPSLKTESQGDDVAEPRTPRGEVPPNNADYPYLTMYLADAPGADPDKSGYYYMVAMTNASKELPIWHWYAMEHVANLGRCDYIGCNDSFGYTADDQDGTAAVFGPSYIPPMTILNDDRAPDPVRGEINDPLFVTGQVYSPEITGEAPTEPLTALLDGMGVGVGGPDCTPDPTMLQACDPVWRNYRLKGTQTTFNTAGGVPTGMGATVTEGGFVNSASCTTCHSQASVDGFGNIGMQGVGASWTTNLLGYGRVEMGTPNMAWFYANGGPSVTATQVDFVWGTFNAKCVNPASDDQKAQLSDVPCALDSYSSAPAVVPAQ
ncbi:hypothetical protein [Roseovarius sp. D22-M7]|uniref:hypothetical protein n=1 Tax=Roseovarius sp. D22-M7 TaxID=3127116 RepID=UPI00300FF281